ncbi:MAG TPA: LuxR C-terminal-related transcriptional regulator [Gaiellaceae bacterium]|nr:LuxR C-terminal-related transcriptional regulator [Gaiellaceae bacterium]
MRTRLARDVALAAAACAAQLAPVASHGDLGVASGLLTAASALPLAARRRSPLGVLVLTTVASGERRRRRPPAHGAHAPAGRGSEDVSGRVRVLTADDDGLVRAGLEAALSSDPTIEESTVKTHVKRILQKLRLRDRVQAVILAYESGLVGPGDGERT